MPSSATLWKAHKAILHVKLILVASQKEKALLTMQKDLEPQQA